MSRAMICIDVFLATVVLGTGAVYGYARYRLDQIHRVALPSAPAGAEGSAPLTDEAPGQPFNLVLVGSDSRGFADKAARQKYGDPSQVGGQRSDTLMVVHVDPAARKAQVLSIHRDLYVPISGTRGSAKINSALDNGPAVLLKTLRDNLGISASHYVQVDFVGFQKVVDTIGPVPFYFPTPVRDANTGLDIAQAGCTPLHGTAALALVRSRHLEYFQGGRWRDDLTDDRGRIVRQQDFLRRVVELAVSHGLGNPSTLNQLIGSVAPNLTVDSGFGTAEMGRLGRRFASAGTDAVTWSVLPVLDTQIDGQDVERLDEPSADTVLAAFGGRAQGALATAGTSTTRASGRGATGLSLLTSDVAVRILGSVEAPGAAEQARQDLAAAGIPATVALAAGPPSPLIHVLAPRELRSTAATLAGIVPGAGSAVDAGLQGSTVLLVVGATWPGLYSAPGPSIPSRSTTTTTLPFGSTTTTTVLAKGTDDRVDCP
jgi:LCP family protein required for cell wall assembly